MSAQKKILLVVSIFIVMASCSVSKPQEGKDFLKPNEVAFIEFFQTQNGVVLKGKYPEGRRIDGPTYRFDRNTKQLEILRKGNFSLDTVKAILGNGIVLKGAAGSGLSMRISPIGKFPYNMNKLTISKVSSEGIYLVFDKKELILKEGDVWETTDTKIDTVKLESPAIIQTSTTYTIHYFGIIDKKSITGNQE